MEQSSRIKWPLHHAVFEGDHDTVRRLLQSGFDLSASDPHGNTALHIAVSIGCEWCCSTLIEHDAPVGHKNSHGWHSLHEAISYGQRAMIMRLLVKFKEQARRKMEVNRPRTLQIVGQLPDFHVTFSWEFSSWIPFVNRVLPNDVCKLYKKGSRLRVDSTLLDFQDVRWDRGDVTFLFNKEGFFARNVDQATQSGEQSDDPSKSAEDEFDSFLVIIDNNRRQFQRLRKRDGQKQIEEEVSSLMSNDIASTHLRFDASRLERERRSGFFGASTYRRTQVGQFEADCYEIHGLTIETRKRREHLSDVEVQRNKETLARMAQRGDLSSIKGIVRHKASLEPPVRTLFDFDTYLVNVTLSDKNATKEASPPSDSLPKKSKAKRDDTAYTQSHFLGRLRKEKLQRKHVHARIAMSTDFPLSVPEFVLVLDVVAPYKKFNRLREFMLRRLPPGFPVKLDIPVYPTVDAKVVFSDFQFLSEKPLPDSFFDIPAGFTENPRLFPGI